jgi:hypothetical protein
LIEKYNDIGNQTHDLPACSTVPQPTTLPRAPQNNNNNNNNNNKRSDVLYRTANYATSLE